MTIRGVIRKGKVILHDPHALSDGTEVEVRRAKKKKSGTVGRSGKKVRRTLAQRLANVIGQATGLPPDASVNHDHYLYGAPKKQ